MLDYENDGRAQSYDIASATLTVTETEVSLQNACPMYGTIMAMALVVIMINTYPGSTSVSV
jgi:hypothetical protein